MGRLFVLVLATSCGFSVPAAAIQSSGETTQTLDPFVVSIDSTVAACEETAVLQQWVADLCGDIDGCTLRLITDAPGLHVVTPTQHLATKAAADFWWIATDLNGSLGNRNGDGIEQTIVERQLFGSGGESGSCTFFDDALVFHGTHYGLEACPDQSQVVRCTLRIDD